MNSPSRVQCKIIAALGGGLAFSLSTLYLARPMIVRAAHFYGTPKVLLVWLVVLLAANIEVIVAAKRGSVAPREGVFAGIIVSLLIFIVAAHRFFK
jgi:hypothetical protein